MRVVYFLAMFLQCILLYGQEKCIISIIEIKGNNITKKNIITRELDFSVNDTLLYSDLQKKIEYSRENLKNLRLFNLVEIDLKEKKDVDKKYVKIIISISLTERWYIWPFPIFEVYDRNFNVWWSEFKESDYSDFSRINYGIFLNWENFRGNNELLRLKFRRGFKEHYALQYRKPYINTEKTIGLEGLIQLFRRKKSFYGSENNALLYVEQKDYTTRDFELKLQFQYRKKTRNTHLLSVHYFNTEISDTILFLNPDYLNNNDLSGDYYKLSYNYINEQRDYVEYPLHGHYLDLSINKFFENKSPVKHFEIIGKAEMHKEPLTNLFAGSSFKIKWTTNDFQPYVSQKSLGYEDYVRGYEYYVIDGQKYWISRSAVKLGLLTDKNFNISFIKMDQFNKSFFSLFLSIFSDIGYVVNNQTGIQNNLSNKILWGRGISLDYVTYYDKILRIEYSINDLGEKGIFLHFSNPFGTNEK